MLHSTEIFPSKPQANIIVAHLIPALLANSPETIREASQSLLK